MSPVSAGGALLPEDGFEMGAKFGYGEGGEVTQQTSRTTAVTLNALSGVIITDTTSLAAEGSADFTVNNDQVEADDVVVACMAGGSDGGGTLVGVEDVQDGSFVVRVHNGNVAAGTAETGAIRINFVVLKARQS